VRRAERLSGQTDLVFVKDVPDADLPGIDALERFSYRPFETDPDMILELPATCTSLDDYFGFLRSKYRSAARAVFEKAERAGYRTARVEDVAKVADRLHELYLQTHSGAKVRLFALHPEYFPRLAEALGPKAFRCTALRRGDAIEGFVSVIRDGETAVAYYMGFDREANEAAPIYFRLLTRRSRPGSRWAAGGSRSAARPSTRSRGSARSPRGCAAGSDTACRRSTSRCGDG
jgi:hypothetical protein